MQVIEFTIQALTPLNSAAGTNRWARRDQRKTWESHVASAVLSTLLRWPPRPWAKARVTITRCSSQEPDGDNLASSAKFILDGLKKAGVIEDDAPSFIGRPDVRWERKTGRGETRVRVECMETYGAQGDDNA